MKLKKSKRNRHTGVINAFKAMVINRGTTFEIRGKVYFRALVGLVLDKNDFRVKGGYCVVRVK